MLINKPTERVLYKSYWVVALLVATLTLAACSPKLDWRTVNSPLERYSALFPGKPDKLERKISFQDQEFKQTLEAIKVDETIYSVSTIQVPAIQAALTKEIFTQLKSNLLDRAKASGGELIEEDAIYQTTSRQRLSTNDHFITLKSNGNAQQQMRVRWIIRQANNGDAWIYQVSVLQLNATNDSPKSLLSQEQYENFFTEFHPE
jgi:hypothetical protein